MNEKTLTAIELSQFAVSKDWFRYSSDPKLFYTKGVRYLVEVADAQWLLHEIFESQEEPQLEFETYQLWKIRVKADGILLVARAGYNRYLFSKKVDYEDFSLAELDLVFYSNMLMLATENK